MCAFKDALSTAVALQERLNERGLQISARVFDEIDSTNTYAKRLALDGETRALVVAMQQTQGRGRMGRSFYSPCGSGVYFSILHTFSEPMSSAVSITSAAAVAVMRAIRRVCGVQTEIKWVNDLYYREKKVCGILAESVVLDGGRCAVVVGIGLNLRSAAFPDELAAIAGTLGADDADEVELIALVAKELEPYLRDPKSRDWLADYREHSCVLGKRVRWTQGEQTLEGKAVDIDADGALAVLGDNGERVLLRTGEITLRLC